MQKKLRRISTRLLSLLLAVTLLLGAAAWAAGPEDLGANGGFSTNLTGWHGVTGSWTPEAGGFRGTNRDLDGYAMSDVAYTPGEPFSYEADFTLNNGSTTAGIIFSVRDAGNPVGYFFSLNVDKGRGDSRIFWNGGGEGFWEAGRPLTEVEKGMNTLTLRLDYDGTSTLKAYLNDVLVTVKSDVALPAGSFGINTFYSDVTYHSVTLKDQPPTSGFTHNLTGWDFTNGYWSETVTGLRGSMNGDGYAVAKDELNGPFTFEGDMTLMEGTAIGILFEAQGSDPGSLGGYCVNFDLGGGALGQQFRIFEYPWKGSLVSDLAKNRFVEAGISPKTGETYHFKLQYADGKISYTFGGVEIFRDIVDFDTTQVYTSGRVGVMGCNALVEFQNLTLTTGAWENQMTSVSLNPHTASVQEDDAFYFLVEDGTDLTRLAPTFALSDGASSDKESGSVQDFSQPVEYRVKAAGGNEKTYTIAVYTPSMASAGDRSAASAVEETIAALPALVTPANQAQVEEASAAYQALTPLQKLLVTNADVLEEKIDQSVAGPIRVLCVGDSITEGYGSSDFNNKSYPAQLQSILGDGYTVYNAGVGGANAIAGGQLSYRLTDRYGLGKAFGPDVVILMLGTNDGIDWVWEREGGSFKADYTALAEEYRGLPTHPKVFLALPMTSYGAEPQKTYIHERIVPTIETIGRELGLDVIDMHTFSAGHPDWFPDGIHPNDGAYTLIAEQFAGYIRGLSEAKLASISIDGEALPGFACDTFSYDISLPRGAGVPEITAGAASKDATVRVVSSSENLPATVTISVTSGDRRGYQEYALTLSEAPQTLTEAKEAALAALDGYEATNDTTAADVMALVSKGIVNEKITAAWTKDFAITKATNKTPGSVTGTITLTLDGAGEDIPIAFTIPALGGGEEPSMTSKPVISGGSGSDWKWPAGSGEKDGEGPKGGKKNPPSGDASSLPIAVAAFALSAGAAVIISRKKK
ncbi:GDSL-type esterase/lipase family protein [Zongyangia hominis]|uniref:SGNH hydrolase-type esterase domain-containing protein n=1 Tax=Zongyangia hominis TaxID=2763677 RepID=A0A926EEP8_9FIRM|nr:GDSL-type esterase/lipase family protein [Zongyangia hominis]MBC8571084.1 hypothetical protein [Zongyangia hominis]